MTRISVPTRINKSLISNNSLTEIVTNGGTITTVQNVMQHEASRDTLQRHVTALQTKVSSNVTQPLRLGAKAVTAGTSQETDTDPISENIQRSTVLTCFICEYIIKNDDKSLECINCLSWEHNHCTGFDDNKCDSITEYICISCTSTVAGDEQFSRATPMVKGASKHNVSDCDSSYNQVHDNESSSCTNKSNSDSLNDSSSNTKCSSKSKENIKDKVIPNISKKKTYSNKEVKRESEILSEAVTQLAALRLQTERLEQDRRHDKEAIKQLQTQISSLNELSKNDSHTNC